MKLLFVRLAVCSINQSARLNTGHAAQRRKHQQIDGFLCWCFENKKAGNINQLPATARHLKAAAATSTADFLPAFMAVTWAKPYGRLASNYPSCIRFL